MATRYDYDVKADESYDNLPVTSFIGEQVDLSRVAPIVLTYDPSGSYSTPVTLWSGGGGFLKSVGDVGGVYGTQWQEMTGCLNPLPNPPHISTSTSSSLPIYVFAYISGSDEEHAELFIKWSWSPQIEVNDVLYRNALSNAESILVPVIEWDNSPSDDPENDPFNMNPKGGEFADTDPLGFGNDEIDVPDTIPELSYSGFISAYKLDDGGVGNLGAAIFTTNTWTNLQNKFNGVGDPISYIISAVEIPYSADPDGVKDFNLGGIKIVDNNNNYVPVSYLEHRYHRLNFGSLTLKETWGTEKDYSGTSVSIYLPYVGVKDLDTAIVMNSVITVKAMLDVWTGDLLYLLVISNKNAAYKYLGSSGIVYRFQGNCGKSIPIGKTDNTTQMLAIAGSIASMGVGLASGLPTGAMGYTVGNEFGASGDVSGNVNPRLVGGGAAGMLGALTMGPKISMAGGVAGAIGRGDYQQPYLIIKQSVPVYPKDWRAHFGAPRYQTFTLGELNGYVKCADVHAESIEGANDAERTAIEQALKAGVFMN